ncbi:MAG: carbohydrate binding family 9 domain-containing protein, partial [bacterium]
MSGLAVKLITICLIAAALNCLANPAAKKSKRKNAMFSVSVRPTAGRPVLDGRLSKNEWVNAATIQNFTQKEPVEGESVSEPTVVLITYDEENIYFGIRCFDKDAQKIVATEMRRDYDLTENDYFEIIIDTYHDQRNAYYFATNSLGARLDCEVKADGKHINWEWDGIWSSKAQKDSLGWT